MGAGYVPQTNARARLELHAVVSPFAGGSAKLTAGESFSHLRESSGREIFALRKAPPAREREARETKDRPS